MPTFTDLISEMESKFDKDILYKNQDGSRWNCMSLDEEKVIKSFLRQSILSAVSQIRVEVGEALGKTTKCCGAKCCGLVALETLDGIADATVADEICRKAAMLADIEVKATLAKVKE